MKSSIICALLAVSIPHAAFCTGSSASYSITTDVLSGGGGKSTSAAYGHEGSSGQICSTPSIAPSEEVFRHGYLAQIVYDAGITLSRSSVSINENSTRVINPYRVFDDGTLIYLSPNQVTWGIVSGPLTSITPTGVLSSGVIHTDSGGVISGSWGAFNTTRNVMIINNNQDDYGDYAGDGIHDDWQVQYFGTSNPDAAPDFDADGDGQNNLFEFTTGLNPADPGSEFELLSEPTVNSTQWNVAFGPIVPGRTYSVKYKLNLSDSTWQPLASFSVADVGSMRVVTDLNAGMQRKFYSIEITAP